MKALAYSTETVIRRSPEDVFDFCSDLRSELQWNPKAKYVEKLTDGPVGVGTRYRARWANSGPTAVEVVRFHRPRRWETNAKARGMDIRFRGTVTDAAPAARYTAYLELHPRRLAWLVAPLALLVMRRQDQKNMHRIREALESSTVTSTSGAAPTYGLGQAPRPQQAQRHVIPLEVFEASQVWTALSAKQPGRHRPERPQGTEHLSTPSR
jgi:uncharacterized protein YndB with AHSA1/START domain